MPYYNSEDFRNVDPGSGKILLFISGASDLTTTTDDTVHQINISSTDCAGNSRGSAVAVLTNIQIGPYSLQLTDPLPKTDYYNFNVNPIVLDSSSLTLNSCTDISFVPTPLANFLFNEYNASPSSEISDRQSFHHFVVDSNRSGSTVLPQNYQSIIDGTAVSASVQPSNYSTVGFINARYNGTKTTVVDYGITPAKSLTEFSGQANPVDLPFSEISSQSVADKTFNNFLFELGSSYGQRGSGIITGSNNINSTLIPAARWRTIGNKAFTVSQTMGSSGTVFLMNDFNTGSGDGQILSVGDVGLIQHHTNKKFEVVKITELKQHGNNLSASVERNYNSDYTELSGETILGTNFAFRRYETDEIYVSENNRLAKVTDKKIYLEETGETIYVNEDGKVIWNFGA